MCWMTWRATSARPSHTAAATVASRGSKFLKMGSINLGKWLDPATDKADDDEAEDAKRLEKKPSKKLYFFRWTSKRWAGGGSPEDDMDDDEEVEPPRWAMLLARLMVRFSPIFFVIFMAIPIGLSGMTASYGFSLDTSFDAFTIRDHPAAEMFNTFVSARDLSRQQDKVRLATHCSPRHPTHFEPSFLELNGILWRGELYLPDLVIQRIEAIV